MMDGVERHRSLLNIWCKDSDNYRAELMKWFKSCFGAARFNNELLQLFELCSNLNMKAIEGTKGYIFPIESFP